MKDEEEGVLCLDSSFILHPSSFKQEALVMLRSLQVGLGIVVVLVLIAAPISYGLHEVSQKRNFHVVRDGVLYRCGQVSEAEMRRLLHDYGFRTVISLRDGLTKSDQAEESFCNSEEVNFVRIMPGRWGDVGGSLPVEEGVRKFREIMSDPKNYPVLIHCWAGIHRTGAYCAIYRMEFEHWSNAQAIAEMKACGYVTLDEELDILGYMEQYRPSWQPGEETSTVGSQEESERPTPAPTTHRLHKKKARGTHSHGEHGCKCPAP
jgi:tyrosine-protein phosphatase SIW14